MLLKRPRNGPLSLLWGVAPAGGTCEMETHSAIHATSGGSQLLCCWVVAEKKEEHWRSGLLARRGGLETRSWAASITARIYFAVLTATLANIGIARS